MTIIKPWINKENNIAFVPTLKVASGTMTEMLDKNGWKRSSADYYDYSIFGITRHPYDRWLSGMAQIISDRGETFDGDIATLITKSYENEHTQPQIWNFAYHKDAKLFKLENLKKVWAWLDIKDIKLHVRDNIKMGAQGDLKKELGIAALPFKNYIISIYSYDLLLWENSL